MKKVILKPVLMLAVIFGLLLGNAQAQKPELSIIWFAWPPCDLLGAIAADYPDADVSITCVPIGQWFDQIFLDFSAQGGADLPVVDSQFMGAAVEGGHIIDMTDFVQNELPVDDYVPAALAAYAEVPAGSGKLYSAPVMTDTRMLVYRKDLFEAEGFAPPTSWSELLLQAQTFKSSDAVDSGFATHWLADGDLVATTWNHILWSFGGELWDPATQQVEGVLNTDVAVEAIEFANKLWETAPTGAGSFGFDETVGAICNGTVAMGEIWFGFGGAFTNPDGCAEAENLGFAVVPGEEEHFISLGGMGISVSAYSENQEASLEFIKWLQSDEIQTRWVEGGGFSGRTSILQSDAFLNAAPFNPSFSEAFQRVKDFWNTPEFNTLLGIQQEYLNLAITGQMDPKEALDEIAAEQQAVLDDR